MSDTLSETRACNLLARLFRGRGYAIERNVMFREYGVEFHVDGWDAAARVGFEFLSSEDDDHDDLDLGEYQALMAAQLRGELALFILDEVEPLNAAELTASATEFLDEMEASVAARRAAKRAKPAPRRKAATRRPKTVSAKRVGKTAKKSAQVSVKRPAKQPATQAAATRGVRKAGTAGRRTGTKTAGTSARK